ncbi:hypothetical protein SODG_005867 [Sodalis praecaptivus]
MIDTGQVIRRAIAIKQLVFFNQCQAVQQAVIDVGLQHRCIIHHLTGGLHPVRHGDNCRTLLLERQIGLRFLRLLLDRCRTVGKQLFLHIFQRITGNAPLCQQIAYHQTPQSRHHNPRHLHRLDQRSSGCRITAQGFIEGFRLKVTLAAIPGLGQRFRCPFSEPFLYRRVIGPRPAFLLKVKQTGPGGF